MKQTHALSWIYLGATASLSLAVATRHPSVDTSSTAQNSEGLELLIWVLVSVGIGLLHDQTSVLTAPHITPWRLVLTLAYALVVAGGMWWIGAQPVASNTPASPAERVVGVSFAWGLFCIIPWALGRLTVRQNASRADGAA